MNESLHKKGRSLAATFFGVNMHVIQSALAFDCRSKMSFQGKISLINLDANMC